MTSCCSATYHEPEPEPDIWETPRNDEERKLAESYKCYTPESCDLAIQGCAIPSDFGNPVTLACLVRGIRYHSGFAAELRGRNPVLTRALNAREIMSGNIPDMPTLEDRPYCIWHPHTASESTYYKLVQQYPDMAYQVGRACAVAGYTNLYRKLNLEPDAHIAEEARDNNSTEIFRDIMAHCRIFSIMNDYNRSVATDITSIHPVLLNSDTQVRSMLEIKHKYARPRGMPPSWPTWLNPGNSYFNITEDFCVNNVDEDEPRSLTAARRAAVPYFYTPLPLDHLPALDKDLLILVAAYNGEVDRYSRLRRPVFLTMEVNCIVRGIYHCTFFSRWWSERLDWPNNIDLSREHRKIVRAVAARAIMDNDLSRIKPDTPKDLMPYCIWYPARPHGVTLKRLLQIRPDMRDSIARACVVSDYQHLFDQLNPLPNEPLLAEAKASWNPHYLEKLQSRLEPAHEDGHSTEQLDGLSDWKKLTRREAYEESTMWLVPDLAPWLNEGGFDWLYNGSRADISDIQLHVSAREYGGADLQGNTVRTAFGKTVDEMLEREGYVDLGYEYKEGVLSQDQEDSAM